MADSADVAFDATGKFVVVWDSRGPAYSIGTGVFGQRYDASGLPQGGEFRIGGTPGFPAVASLDTSGFVVVWNSPENPYLGEVFGQRYDASGAPQGGFRVNSYTTSGQGFPAVASDVNGNFVVVWWSNGQDGSGTAVIGRRFDWAIFRDGFE